MSEYLIQILDRFRLPLALSLIGVVLILGGLFLGNSKSQPKSFPKESLVEGPGSKLVTVDVSGAVNKPGVYKLKDGSRVEDAVSAAGGFSQDAQAEYIAKVLNLAQRLADGSKVYIPKIGEAASNPVIGAANGSFEAKVNINSAPVSQLDSLPGVGEVTAGKIISGRPYQTIEELLSKKVISKGVFDKIKDRLVLY